MSDRKADGELIDISPAITSAIAVFPGDTPFSRRVLLDMADGANLTLSTMETTLHLGSHADAESHYAIDGRTIESMPLELYVGACDVVEVTPSAGERVQVDDIHGEIVSPRVLIRTGTQPDKNVFGGYCGLSPALVHHLATRRVRLIGVDTPSVDPGDSKALEAHAACREHGIAIIEGLVLDGVPLGQYELIALPLKIVGGDASPVRAVLRRLG